MKITGILFYCLILSACTTIEYVDGPVKFTRTSFGTQLQITGLQASVDPEGTRTINLTGYVSDQVQAMEKIAEGAARGAAAGANPLP